MELTLRGGDILGLFIKTINFEHGHLAILFIVPLTAKKDRISEGKFCPDEKTGDCNSRIACLVACYGRVQ